MLRKWPWRSGWTLSVSALVLAVLFNSAHHAPEIGVDHGNVVRIEHRVLEEMGRRGIPGLSVSVGFQNQVWSGGYGLADLENQVPVTTQTMFRLASISKPITAVAALELARAGRLDLDAPVQTYVKEFPEKPWPLTTRQLLGHLGGIRNYRGDEIRSTRSYAGVIDALAIFKDDPLNQEPGTRYAYSTYGYNLVGAVVERASGELFLEYLRMHVFRPAGMTTIRDDRVADLIPHRARGYRRTKSGQLQNSELADLSNKLPGGGLISTAEDLVRFVMALRDGVLLDQTWLKTMWTSQRTQRKNFTGYGLGWRVGRHAGQREIFHTGAQPQVSTLLYYQPESGVIVTIMVNLEGVELIDLARSIAGIVSPPGPLTETDSPPRKRLSAR